MPDIAYDNSMVISFTTKDLAKAMAWYQGTLGFEVAVHIEEAGWAELKTPVAGLTIGLGTHADTQPSSGCVPVIGVADIEAARATMEANGVEFAGPTDVMDGMVKLATFHDCDGHTLMLAQNLMPMD